MTENELKNLLAAVTPPDEAARAAARAAAPPGRAGQFTILCAVSECSLKEWQSQPVLSTS